MIQETFLEAEWDNEEEARAARDARVEQLQESGMLCSCENLYNILDGRRVFLLEAREAEPVTDDPAPTRERHRPSLRPKRLNRTLPKFEER